MRTERRNTLVQNSKLVMGLDHQGESTVAVGGLPAEKVLRFGLCPLRYDFWRQTHTVGFAPIQIRVISIRCARNMDIRLTKASPHVALVDAFCGWDHQTPTVLAPEQSAGVFGDHRPFFANCGPSWSALNSASELWGN
uniref:Uncharacterized protein n=1 Tax=Eutreptiella gymnastica TaxID=73025 RepID=A0A7S1HWP3_9EUGL